MSVFLTSDLHLGWESTADRRGFSSISEHDDYILHNLSFITKRDKLFVLGDVARDPTSLMKLTEIRGVKDMVMGNHDLIQMSQYLKVFNRVWGFVKYKQFWLSHCPIHPQEMHRMRANIHGHIHNGGITGNIDGPYFNVNVDFNNYEPVSFMEIDKLFTN